MSRKIHFDIDVEVRDKNNMDISIAPYTLENGDALVSVTVFLMRHIAKRSTMGFDECLDVLVLGAKTDGTPIASS